MGYLITKCILFADNSGGDCYIMIENNMDPECQKGTLLNTNVTWVRIPIVGFFNFFVNSCRFKPLIGKCKTTIMRRWKL